MESYAAYLDYLQVHPDEFKALETIGDTNVISTPRLLTLNKQRAEILIGSELGYVSTTVTETITSGRRASPSAARITATTPITTLIGSGQIDNVSGGSSGFNNAVLRLVATTLASATSVGPGDTLTYRPVVPGRLTDGLRIVTSGLKPGERIVVNGLMRVRPGMKVAPTLTPMVADSITPVAER